MNNNLCPTCQSPIPADAPGGICPACALLGVANPTSATQVAGASIPMLDEIAAAFPELEVLEMCGQGGMGVVFKARQPKLDRLVAVKILTPALATQPGFAERFTREARALAKLSHPNIVGVHDFGESGGFFYLTMEFVDGVNLRQAMRAGVTPEQALLLVPKVCEALQFAHDHGVLHRDIKPENILLDTRGTPKLADFGIAKLGDDKSTGLTLSGAQLGTAAYMAPEQIEHPATVDHRADIYSLGVVLYEMLTGELPLGRFAAPSEKAHCSSGVDDVVLRALEKQRERRQQSATEMKTQVEGAGNIGIVAGRAPDELSKTAVLGMLFVVACIPAGIALFHVAQQFKDIFPKRPATVAAVIPFVVLVALIGSALGWHGVVAIRNSAGRLGGRIAAVVGALFFPVYFPAWFLVANCYDLRTIINRDSGPYSMPGYGTPIALAAAASILAIVWLITRVVWRFSCAEKSGVPVRRPEVAAAVPQPRCLAPFSMAAAAGAILSVGSIPFGLVLFLIVKAILNPPMESGSQLNGPFAGNIVIFGFLPALIGVALGWKAVGDFRYHRGHLRGGGTAVFAALGIPVLALVTTTVVNFEDIDRAINPLRIGSSGILAACIVVLAAFAASIWAVKALWKFVHHGPQGVPLPHSNRSRGSRVITILAALPLVAAVGIAFYVWDSATNRGFEFGYYGELNKVKNALARVPGVESVRVTAANNDIGLEEFSLEATMREGEKRNISFLETDPLRDMSGAELERALGARIKVSFVPKDTAPGAAGFLLPVGILGAGLLVAVLLVPALVRSSRRTPANVLSTGLAEVSFEYISPRTWLGMPLVHIVRRVDPRTGKMPVARGVFAVGVKAHGVVAIGVFASGGITIGVVSFGVFAIGTLAIGMLAGGVAAFGLLAGGVQAIGVFSAIGVNVIGDIAKGVNATGRFYVEGVAQRQVEWLRTPLAIAASITALVALIPWRCPANWPRLNFRCVLAAIALFAVALVYYFVPSGSVFQPIPARNRIGHAGTIEIRGSAVHFRDFQLDTAVKIPFGWVADFQFMLHDENGWSEIPEISFTSAQAKAPAELIGEPILPLEGRWEFSGSDVPQVGPKIKGTLKNLTKVRSGGWYDGASTAHLSPLKFSGTLWELHPDRPRFSSFDPKRQNVFPFLRKRVNETDAKGAEIILRIDVRPLREDEPVPEYTVISNKSQEERMNRLRADFAVADAHAETIKLKNALVLAEAHEKKVAPNTADAFIHAVRIKTLRAAIGFLREELATPIAHENLADSTPELDAVKIRIAQLKLRIWMSDEKRKKQTASGGTSAPFTETPEVVAAREELGTLKTKREEMVQIARDRAADARRTTPGDGYERVVPRTGYRRIGTPPKIPGSGEAEGWEEITGPSSALDGGSLEKPDQKEGQ